VYRNNIRRYITNIFEDLRYHYSAADVSNSGTEYGWLLIKYSCRREVKVSRVTGGDKVIKYFPPSIDFTAACIMHAAERTKTAEAACGVIIQTGVSRRLIVYNNHYSPTHGRKEQTKH